jgi:hypothetical protein
MTDNTPTTNEIKDLALRTLKAVCDDADAPAAAKAGAARTMCEIIGLIGKNSQSDALATKSLADMNASELDAEIARLSSK